MLFEGKKLLEQKQKFFIEFNSSAFEKALLKKKSIGKNKALAKQNTLKLFFLKIGCII